MCKEIIVLDFFLSLTTFNQSRGGNQAGPLFNMNIYCACKYLFQILYMVVIFVS